MAQLDISKGQNVIRQIQDLEVKARAAGLPITARGLNNALNAAGWELAGDIVTAGMATRGERPGE